MFTLAFRKPKTEFISYSLTSNEEIPTDDTYVNMYVNNDNDLYTLDNEGNTIEFEGETE